MRPVVSICAKDRLAKQQNALELGVPGPTGGLFNCMFR